MNATYTLARALAYNGNSAAFRNRAFNPFDIFAAYDLGPTPTDTRHRFSMGGVVNLPGGFQVAPIVQLESARPYTIGYPTLDVLGVGGGRGTSHAIVFNNSPNDLIATYNSFGTTTKPYRDCLRAGTCSIAAFDNARGQPFFQLDARITKNFKIKERANIQAIFQVFDLTNRANFGNNFDGNIIDAVGASPTFGKPTAFITPSGVTVPHSLSAELGLRFSF